MTPGMAGLSMPKNPKRNTHANIDMSMTTLMPKRFRKKGIIRMQRASLICDIDVSSVALLAANDVAIAASALPLKLVMNGPA